MEQRFSACFAARDWDAIAELIADDFSMDDRRHGINAGFRHGRDAEIASLRAVADVGVTSMTLSTVIAIRGGRLALGCYFVSDGWGGTEVLGILEVNAENHLLARVAFDPDDVDAAFEELMPVTSPVKRRLTRAPGRSTQGSTPPSTGTNFPQPRRSGSISTTGRS